MNPTRVRVLSPIDQDCCSTWFAKLFIAGPIQEAKQLLRRECMNEGLCVTIDPTLYIYTGGEEVGYVVGFINYPRFPMPLVRGEIDLQNRVISIAEKLMASTYQKSCSLMFPGTTIFLRNPAFKGS